MSQDFHLHGRVALVTGSSKGLGKAMAFALGKAGARVALNYANDQAWAERTFAEFTALGYEGALFRANVTDEHEVNHMVADIERPCNWWNGWRRAPMV